MMKSRPAGILRQPTAGGGGQVEAEGGTLGEELGHQLIWPQEAGGSDIAHSPGPELSPWTSSSPRGDSGSQGNQGLGKSRKEHWRTTDAVAIPEGENDAEYSSTDSAECK